MTRHVTTQDFILRARKVHGDKYDYSRVGYVNSRTKVKIRCSIHGWFVQRPDTHLSGKGCRKCGLVATVNSLRSTANSRRTGVEDFIKQATLVHKNKYRYLHVAYVNTHTKVEITCPLHGSFMQTPKNHLHDHGCPRCGAAAIAGFHRSDTKSFIKKARGVHKDKYTYSGVEYTGSNTKVEITCPLHGGFAQVPTSHLAGNGCPACGTEAIGAFFRSDTKSFIKKAKGVHKGRYDYSEVRYRGAHINVTITCPRHGGFMQSPSNHLAGKGCLLCGHMVTGDALRSDTKSFIEKARVMHGDKYDYSKVRYFKECEKVNIICPQHGGFRQVPNSHLGGNACPNCAVSGYQPSKLGYLYILLAAPKGIIKIGITNTPHTRHQGLRRVTPFPFKVVYCQPMEGRLPPIIENAIKKTAVSAGLKGFDGATEWLINSDNLIPAIKAL